MAQSSVRFVEGVGRILSELEIETVDRAELASVLTETLFNLRIQIVRFEVRQRARRLQARLAIVEFDGAHITPSRRAEVQAAVLSVIEIAGGGLRKVRSHGERMALPLEATS
jgi:hypothetical protein